MKDKKLQTLITLGIAWVIMFIMMLITKTPTARGTLALITVACVLWFAYWTIATIRGTTTEDSPNESKPTRSRKKND
jgi:threonine/homoserine/homoserine lactone efflux protein